MPTRPYHPAEGLINSGLDLSQPFTTAMAARAGLDCRRLQRILGAGLLARPLLGVYYAATLRDCLDLRIACLRLVVPHGCVVTDRTAGWLHGASMALAPNDHLRVPLVSVFHTPGNRLRNALTSSGERELAEHDVTELRGIRVTTPLRTACDLGRLLHRDSALASMDALLRLGSFDQDELCQEVERFKGYRGVRQLRAFAPLTDPGSESFGESVLRLRWYDAGLGVRPETQIQVAHPWSGETAYLDLGSREWRYAAEYDGAAFHGPEQREHDETRRAWIAEHCDFEVDVFRRDDLFGRNQRAEQRLRDGIYRAMVRLSAGSAY
ncbi:type IV toxin-antitoxin system AbiEi family antitoxin domain-containing protein [Marmoricola sp. RAF53]|uniref:type IV toxin-antitoxin system AbiEi family antitoxin domain-containing protein n=1 Tax=Marmoricola sp. RAF53 TaxID=3233059 RepID=UPI003F9C356B